MMVSIDSFQQGSESFQLQTTAKSQVVLFEELIVV